MAGETTSYLNIEAAGTEGLIKAMSQLQGTMSNASKGLWTLNRSLGVSTKSTTDNTAAKRANASAATEAKAAEDNLAAAQLNAATAAKQYTAATQAGAANTTAWLQGLTAQAATMQNLTVSLGNIAAGFERQAQAQAQAKIQTQTSAGGWADLAGKVTVYKMAVEAAVGLVVKAKDAFIDLSAAANTQQKAQQNLTMALSASGIKGGIADLEAWASELQKVTVSGDEVNLQLATTAAYFSKDKEAIKASVEAALDFSAATGQNASVALNAMGMALSGRTTGLRQLGIFMDEQAQKEFKAMAAEEKQAKLLQLLQERYDGMAKEIGATPAGVVEQINNYLGDNKEILGDIINSLNNSLAITTSWGEKVNALTIPFKGLNLTLGLIKDKLQANQEITDEWGSTYNPAYIKRITTTAEQDALRAGAAKMANEAAGEGGADTTPPPKTGGKTTAKETPLQSYAKTLAIIEQQEKAARAASEWVGNTAIQEQYLAEQLKKYADDKAAAAVKYYEAIGDYQSAAEVRAVQYEEKELEKQNAAAEKEKERQAKELEELEARNAQKLTIEQQYQTQLAQIKATAAAKMTALDQLTTDTPEAAQWAAEQRLEIARNEQEQLSTIKIDYATRTGDQLTALSEQYAQAQAQAEIKAQEQVAATQKQFEGSLQSALGGLKTTAKSVFTSLMEGTDDWRSALYDGFTSLGENLIEIGLKNIISLAAQNQAAAMQSQASIPYVGPILAVAAGAAMLATTLALKSKLKEPEIQYANGGYISAGLVKGGAYGRDSVTAALMPGERVLSKAEAEQYDTGRGGATFNITVNVSGQLDSPERIRDTVRNKLIPEIQKACRQGYSLA